MTAPRERPGEVFLAALDRAPADREAYIDDACGDDRVLREEVESLLAHHDEAPLIEEASADDAEFPMSKTARYRTIGQLGSGGFGVVVQRFDRSLRRLVACKSPLVAEEAHTSALLREARLLSYLDHPGVVQVYDLDENSASVCYTMELLNGESVAQHLGASRKAEQPLAVSEALRIVTRLCETVANAHAKGVIHLDIKPDNVMLQSFGRVSLIDWGLAHFYDRRPYREHLAQAGEAELDSLFSRALIGGTPIYMPPEQFDSEAVLGPAADIYSIGTLFFELLTGAAAV